MVKGGSQQLRRYRIARRDGATREEACGVSGISIGEAKSWDEDDARNPPSEECYVLLGANPVHVPDPSPVVLVGDCRALMAAMPDCSVDSIVTDPPYELGFMGKAWDSTGIAYDAEMWRQCFRVLKPGGHVLSFSGSRTYHRMAVAIEDAGFEIRDQLMWIYGSGFPKSHDVSKAIDKAAGAERKIVGRGASGKTSIMGGLGGTAGEYGHAITTPATPDAARWSGWGTALKPAHEPICMARKPLIGTVAQNVLTHGTGGINIDACRVEMSDQDREVILNMGGFGRQGYVRGRTEETFMQGTPIASASVGHAAGRFPANVLHDGEAGFGEEGRFFYSAKASRADREAGMLVEEGRGNVHPTVKPTDVMRWLVRMVTPPGGLVLDPFNGSGSTGRAAVLEGMRYVGCELSEEYAAIARARIADAVESLSKPVKARKAPNPRKPVQKAIKDARVQGDLFA